MPPSDAGGARSRAACSESRQRGDGAKKSLDTSLEEETERFKQTSEALDSVLSENSRLQSSLEAERKVLGSPIKEAETPCLDSQPAQVQTAAVALSFSPAKRPSVPVLTLSALVRSDDASTAPKMMSESASMGCQVATLQSSGPSPTLLTLKMLALTGMPNS